MKKKIILPLFFLIFSIYALTSRAHVISDGAVTFIQTVNFVNTGSLCFAKQPDGSEFGRTIKTKISQNKQYCYTIEPLRFLNYIVPVATGVILEKITGKDPKHKFAHFLCGLWNAFIATMANIIFFLLLLKLSVYEKKALFMTLALSFSTQLWFYSRNIFMEYFQLLWILLSLYLLLLFYLENNKKWFFISYLLAGLIVALKFSSITYSLTLFLILPYLFLKKNINIRDVLLSLLLLYSGILIFSFANWLKFGEYTLNIKHTYMMNVLGRGRFESYITGLWGILFSPGKSILLYNIPILFALPYFKEYYKRHRESALFTLLFSTITIFAVASRNWTGGMGWGPRYLSMIVPLLIIPLAYGKNIILKIAFVSGIIFQIPSIILPSYSYAKLINILGYTTSRTIVDSTNFIPSMSSLILYWKLFISRILFKLGLSTGYIKALDWNKGFVKINTSNISEFWFWFFEDIPIYLKLFAVILILSATTSLFFLIKNTTNKTKKENNG